MWTSGRVCWFISDDYKNTNTEDPLRSSFTTALPWMLGHWTLHSTIGLVLLNLGLDFGALELSFWSWAFGPASSLIRNDYVSGRLLIKNEAGPKAQLQKNKSNAPTSKFRNNHDFLVKLKLGRRPSFKRTSPMLRHPSPMLQHPSSETILISY